MKIIKAHKSKNGGLYLMVDEIPKITYEKIGLSYIGSDEQGLFNEYLKFENYYGKMKAFAGREIEIELKNGEKIKLKDNWWDAGTYDKSKQYISIGIQTKNRLRDCYVYCGMNVSESAINDLLEEYLKHDIFYEYYEIEDWLKLDFDWYDLKFHGMTLQFSINNRGDVINNTTLKREYVRNNISKYKNGKSFNLSLFKLKYQNNGKLIKLEDKYENIVKESLPEFEFEEYLKYLERRK